LAWLGKALGSCQEADAWADLLFTTKDIALERLWPEWTGPYMPKAVPGLGLSIVRYNVGGLGRVEDQAGEARSSKTRGWHAEIEGYLPTPGSDFDWSRDEAQRRFLMLAVDRGVDQVELFSNAPMWWMSHTASSFGGSLARPDEFAAYLAEVAAHARISWGVPVRSVAPFNEPSADWWCFPHNQEGCRIPLDQQARVVARLRDELDRRSLGDVLVAASDENRPDEAARTWQELHKARATGYVGSLNVHSYDGLEPWREEEHPGHRAALCRLAAKTRVPVWVSEHGNGDPSGVALAQCILEDLHHLKPSAWCYWQPVEHRSPWGFVEAEFKPNGVRPVRLPHPKYFVFAHFSRFLRRGFAMLHCTEPWAAAAYSTDEQALACVFANPAPAPRRLRLRLPAFSACGGGARGTGAGPAAAVVTEPRRGRVFVEQPVEVAEGPSGCLELRMEVAAFAVCSVALPRARLRCGAAGGGSEVAPGVTAAQVQAMALRAARGAADERLHGAGDARTQASWACWEHECGLAAAALGAGPPAAPPPGSGFGDLVEVVCGGAWGAANERRFGAGAQDALKDWERFHRHAELLAAAGGASHGHAHDLIWMVFNTCWAVINERWYGTESGDCREAWARAEQHLSRVGPETVVLRPCG